MNVRAFTLSSKSSEQGLLGRIVNWLRRLFQAGAGRGEVSSLLEYLQEMLESEAGPVRVTVAFIEDEMTDPQRKRLNAMCGDLAKQLRLDFATGQYVLATEAPGGKRLDTDSWRHMMVAVLKGQTSVPHPEGRGFIVLGQSSKQLGKRLTCELIDLIDAFGSTRGVRWTDPTQPRAADYTDIPQYHRNAA